MNARYARWTAFLVGFLSLSSELLWIRLAGFAFNSRPQVFSLVLAAFLAGIACGALAGRWLHHRGIPPWPSIGISLVLAGIADLTLPWLVAAGAGTALHVPTLLWCVAISAALKAVCFPLVHELGSVIDLQRAGRSFSTVYVSNILGSCLGPLLTGYGLLQCFTTQTVFVLIAVITMALGYLCCWRVMGRITRYGALAAMLMLIPSIVTLPNRLMQLAAYPPIGEHVNSMVENRYGVLHTTESRGLDRIYGGNVYDGAFNINPGPAGNRIERAYFVAAVHPAPRKVLMIGLSSGSWLTVLLQRPDVVSVDVVEINPGYLDLIEHYPEQRLALRDPRVRMHIDDGRRWLRRHPAERFDLVIMNTSHHWRAHATTVLSLEFLQQINSHLRPQGMVYYNSTSSIDVVHTATQVFAQVWLYQNFILASHDDPIPTHGELTHRLGSFRRIEVALGSQPRPRPLNTQEIASVLATSLQPAAVFISAGGRTAETITDSNMITEFKHGIGLTTPYQ